MNIRTFRTPQEIVGILRTVTQSCTHDFAFFTEKKKVTSCDESNRKGAHLSEKVGVKSAEHFFPTT